MFVTFLLLLRRKKEAIEQDFVGGFSIYRSDIKKVTNINKHQHG